jgi:hypothetical protein
VPQFDFELEFDAIQNAALLRSIGARTEPLGVAHAHHRPAVDGGHLNERVAVDDPELRVRAVNRL